MAVTELSSWITELAQYLHANTVGVFGNTPTANIFLQTLPDSPVIAIALIASGGRNDPDGIDPLNRPTLQVLVRRTKSIDGLNYAKLVFSVLDNTWNITPSFNGRLVGDHLPGPNYQSAAGYTVYILNFTSTLGRK